MIPTSERWNWSLDIDHTFDLIDFFVTGYSQVLDYGCGLGRLMHPLAEAHPEIQFYGYDPDPVAIGFASSRALPNETYSVEPEHCEAAYSVLVFQHLRDDQIRWELADRWMFQYVVGGEQGPDMIQRDADWWVPTLDDPFHPEWRWGWR